MTSTEKSGPLAQQIAQVWEALQPLGSNGTQRANGRAALSAIERHVQDMEKAIGEALESLATGPARDGYAYSILNRLAAPSRAATPTQSGASPEGNDGDAGAASTPALSVSGTQTAANAGRNRVAREKGTE